ncbi:MAG TPA: DUF3575 domain-containing protein [Chitinophagaceae bacterium]
MRKVLFAAMLFLGVQTANAQEEGNGQNVIKVNPLGLIFGSANVGFERAINEKSSFVIAPQFGGFKLGGMKYSSFGAGAQYRMYFSKTKTAPEGFYGAPGLSFVSGKVKYDDGMNEKEEIKFSSFGGGVMVGHQWIYNSGFVLDLGAGVNYQKFNYKDNEDNSFALKASGMLPALSFSIGYNF